MNKKLNNKDKKKETFIEGLIRVSKRVEKMPQWKKEGWAILDDPNSPYYCGVRKKNKKNE